MLWIVSAFLSLFLCGCGGDHDQNDPYVIENTEVDYQPPAPYYDSESS